MAGDSFTWPPRTESPTASIAPTTITPSRIAPPRRSLVRTIEEVFLGSPGLTLEQAYADGAWRPDEPGDACWRCGTAVGEHEADADGCGTCRSRRLAWDRCIRLGAYDAELKDAIQRLKFHRSRFEGRTIGRLLGGEIAHRLSDAGIPPTAAAIVPIPMTVRRRVARGVDHTAVIAAAAGARAGVEVVPALRKRHTPPQVGLSATLRARNISGSIVPRRGRWLSRACRVIIVLDDVRTTGATLTAGCRAVRRASEREFSEIREVWAVTGAVTRERARRATREMPTASEAGP